MMTDEERLIRALKENMCGDDECQKHRVDAAILVLTGAGNHRGMADKVIPREQITLSKGKP